MKYLMLVLPSLLPFSLAMLMSLQAGSLPNRNTAEQRDAAVRELRMERGKITARISVLESEGRNFLPR